MKHVLLTRMKAGKKGKIVEISGNSEFLHRLSNMGIYFGREITKIDQFALRGPVTIRTGRSVVAISHGIAHKIRMEVE